MAFYSIFNGLSFIAGLLKFSPKYVRQRGCVVVNFGQKLPAEKKCIKEPNSFGSIFILSHVNTYSRRLL